MEGLSTVAKVPGDTTPRETNKGDTFENRVEEFLLMNPLKLEIPKREVTVAILEKSPNKTILDDYVIANDFPLTTEGSNITLAYKKDSEKLLVAKKTKKGKMDELANLHNWRDSTPEEYLKRSGFSHLNVLLPSEIIKKGNEVYRFYEAMDIDLEKYLETHNRLSVIDGVSLMVRACDGIKALNQAGIVNVDLAPLNIMLTNTSLKLIDLDGAAIDRNDGDILSRNYSRSNRFTSSPELFEQKPVFDTTVDVYAAATNLYRLIVGDWPYNIEAQTRGLSVEEKRDAYKELHQAGSINFPNFIPTNIQKVIRRGMSPNPKDRYQSMQEFMSELMGIEIGDLYIINNQGLGPFLDRYPTNEQKVEALNELLEKHLNNEILRRLNFYTTVEEIRAQFEQCIPITSPVEFIKRIHDIIKPIDLAREKHPEVFAGLERKIFMESHPDFIPLNEMLSYRIDGGDLHLHLAPVADFSTSKKIQLIKDAFTKVRAVITSEKGVTEISATSWVVSNNPRLFERMGFTIKGPISVQEKKIDFEGETRPVSRATISRKEFLTKYSKKTKFVQLMQSWIAKLRRKVGWRN